MWRVRRLGKGRHVEMRKLGKGRHVASEKIRNR